VGGGGFGILEGTMSRGNRSEELVPRIERRRVKTYICQAHRTPQLITRWVLKHTRGHTLGLALLSRKQSDSWELGPWFWLRGLIDVRELRTDVTRIYQRWETQLEFLPSEPFVVCKVRKLVSSPWRFRDSGGSGAHLRPRKTVRQSMLR
jgi:hypothetical protein